METGVAEVVETHPCPCSFKVHQLMCAELNKLIDRISKIFPEIEAARPRCSAGIQTLCMLNSAIEKTKQLLQYCTDSSKLYLAITGDVIVSRCQRSRSLLERSLSQIQSMVPVMLAVEISQIIDDLRAATFIMDASEDEAGKVVRELLQQRSPDSDSRENSEIKAIQFAAAKLHIASPKTLLIEKRSIKKLLHKNGDSDPTKGKILKYLLHLLNKYGNSIMKDQAGNACGQCEELVSAEITRSSVSVCCQFPTDMLGRATPPEEFKCPISMRLMFDPVAIASGQTYERLWIQKWFDEGNDTCPKTEMRLPHLSLTPNTTMKVQIRKWCMKYGITIPDPSVQAEAIRPWETSSASIASFGSSMNDLHLQVDLSNVSLESLDTSYSSDSSHAKIKSGFRLNSLHTNDAPPICHSNVDILESHMNSLLELPELQWDSQCKVVEDLRNQLKLNDQSRLSTPSQNFIEPLINFLRDAQDQHDLKAQRARCQFLLLLVSEKRNGIQYLSEDAFSLLQRFLDSELVEEALAIIEFLSGQWSCASRIAASGALVSILKILDSQNKSFQESAVKILCNLSLDKDICTQIASLELIPKLVALLGDDTLAGYCVKIVKNLCDINGARVSVAETNGCISSIASLFEIGSREDQEHAVSILLSLCSQHVQYCQLVVDEGLIPALVDISINGNDKGKVSAMELLRLLRDIPCYDEQEYRESDADASRGSSNHSKEKKASRFFGRKFAIFPKSNTVAPKKK